MAKILVARNDHEQGFVRLVLSIHQYEKCAGRNVKKQIALERNGRGSPKICGLPLWGRTNRLVHQQLESCETYVIRMLAEMGPRSSTFVRFGNTFQ